MATPYLDLLSARLGIKGGYRDVFGEDRAVGPDTKRRLVAAMGYDAETEAASALSLERLDARADRLSEPVAVVRSGGAALLTVALRTGTVGPISWALLAEDGHLTEGKVAPADLAPAAGDVVPGRRRMSLSLGGPITPGYHRLEISSPGHDDAVTTIIAAPARCLSPEDLGVPSRCWGIAAQLYSLRSARNWGIGDYGDLGRLTEIAAGFGADLVGVSPLHALFPADSNHFGPYGPSSRLFLNVAHIDPGAIEDLADCSEAKERLGDPAFQRRLATARDAGLIDYSDVWALKRPFLELAYRSFRDRHLLQPLGSDRAAAFEAFRKAMGEPLRRLAVFEALHEHFFGEDPGRWSWRTWPEAYRRPDTPAVAAFAAERGDRVTYFQYLQWIADRQLGHAAERARAAGLRAGIYRDLAVAVEAGGADAWGAEEAIVVGASVGAPPDEFNPLGQNWGLAPYSPVALRDRAYEPFIAMVRANMRHARVLRIDHAMNLERLYWIPRGARSAAEGAYVAYPFRDLVAVTALESHRQGCVVVGEDLGTVPEGFREVTGGAGIHSYRVLYFERGPDGRFLAPEAYPKDVMAVATTHDLPTLEGFWSARDLEWRRRLNLYPDEASRTGAETERVKAKRALLAALVDAGVLISDWGDPDHRPFDQLLLLGLHRFLARTPAAFVMTTLEDLIGEVEQPNLPGTVQEHPNWRRRLPLGLEQIATSEKVRDLAAAMGLERPT